MTFFFKLNYAKTIIRIKGCMKWLHEMAGPHQKGIVTQRTSEEKAALLFLEDTFTDQSQEMLDYYRMQLLDYCQKREYQVLVVLVNILRWRSHPISWNRAMESVIESHSSDGGSHDPCRGSQ